MRYSRRADFLIGLIIHGCQVYIDFFAVIVRFVEDNQRLITADNSDFSIRVNELRYSCCADCAVFCYKKYLSMKILYFSFILYELLKKIHSGREAPSVMYFKAAFLRL